MQVKYRGTEVNKVIASKNYNTNLVESVNHGKKNSCTPSGTWIGSGLGACYCMRWPTQVGCEASIELWFSTGCTYVGCKPLGAVQVRINIWETARLMLS